MRTTIKQQMKAVKKAMISREAFCKGVKHKEHTEDKNWLALNDAYSTLAAIALTQSITKDINTVRQNSGLALS